MGRERGRERERARERLDERRDKSKVWTDVVEWLSVVRITRRTSGCSELDVNKMRQNGIV